MGAPFCWWRRIILLVEARPSTFGRHTPTHLQRGRRRSGRATTGEMNWHFSNFVIGFDLVIRMFEFDHIVDP